MEEKRTIDEANTLFHHGQYAIALVRYTELLADASVSKDPLYHSRLLLNRSSTFVKLNDYKSAKSDLLEALNLDANLIAIKCQLAYVELYLGYSLNALRLYAEVIKLNINSAIDDFKSLLKSSIDLCIDRANSQGYTKEEIDQILTPEVKKVISDWNIAKTDNTNNNNIVPDNTPARTTSTTTTLGPNRNITTTIINGNNEQVQNILNTINSQVADPNNPLSSVMNIGSNVATALNIFRNHQQNQANNSNERNDLSVGNLENQTPLSNIHHVDNNEDPADDLD